MKVLSKIVLGLSLSAQVFSAPLEERQASSGTINTVNAAVNRLLSRALTEIFSLNTLLPSPGVSNPPGMPTAINNVLSSATNNLGSANSLMSGGTGTNGCALSAADVTSLITNLGSAQSIVNSLQTTLTTAASTLSASDISAIASHVQGVVSAVTTVNGSLQSYAASLVPCASTVAPTLVVPLQNAAGSLATTVDGLTAALGVGGLLDGLVTTIVP